MKEIIYYTTKNGKCPYIEWLTSLDLKTQSIIVSKIDKLKDNLGDTKRLKNSKLSELRIFTGKGYRVYFKDFNNIIILIVAGSDKGNQTRVIQQANKYFEDFMERNKG